MTNGGKKTLIWILTWASLLLVVLYSPIGSPELYTGTIYYIPNLGVNFNENQIANSNKRTNYADNGTEETAIPEYTDELQKTYSYSVSSSVESSHSDYASVSSVNTTSFQSNKSAAANGDAMNGGFILSGNRSDNSTTNKNSGFLALSTDLNLMANTGTRQSAGASTSGGSAYTDPGGDPTGPPIPVGDGWIFLLVLVTGYTFRKLKQIKKPTKISII